MKVTLDHVTPLHIASNAIRQCWQSQGKSDTDTYLVCDKCNSTNIEYGVGDDNINECKDCFTTKVTLQTICGPNDKALIDRIGNKFKHSSTLEHIVFNFTIEGVSRALLQELARHRMASPSVKSTRYTLKELKNEELIDCSVFEAEFSLYSSDVWQIAGKYIVSTENYDVDISSCLALEQLQINLKNGIANDVAKYCLPEAYKTDLAWTINARSLQNFLSLRTSKSALWEIRILAKELFNSLPEDYKYLFEDCLSKED